jgi:hypothetical protein
MDSLRRALRPREPCVNLDLSSCDYILRAGSGGRLLRLVLEVIDGRRPAAQLDGVVVASVLRYVRAARPARRPVRVSRLLSLRVCRPVEHAVEAAAVVGVDQRVRAVAARFELEQAGWRCVPAAGAVQRAPATCSAARGAGLPTVQRQVIRAALGCARRTAR